MSLSRRTPTRKSLHRKTLHPRTPKITLIAAGSALALAGIAAGTLAAWPGDTPAASASLAAAASLAGSRNVAASAGTDHVMAASVHQFKVSGAAARQAAQSHGMTAGAARDPEPPRPGPACDLFHIVLICSFGHVSYLFAAWLTRKHPACEMAAPEPPGALPPRHVRTPLPFLENPPVAGMCPGDSRARDGAPTEGSFCPHSGRLSVSIRNSS